MHAPRPRIVSRPIPDNCKGKEKPQARATPAVATNPLHISKFINCDIPSNYIQGKPTSNVQREENLASKFDSMELVVSPESLVPQLICPNCKVILSMKNKQEQVQETRSSRQMVDTHSIGRRVQSQQPSLKA